MSTQEPLSYVAMEEGKQTSVPYVLSWKNVKYTVPLKKGNSKVILNDVSGRIEPGQVTAVMGPSGSGKTTLLDTLADRLSTGEREGDILVNGAVRDENSFRAISNYVAQEDSLMGSFTVLETLRFSAALSLAKHIDGDEKERRVQKAIVDMGLTSCKDTIVGNLFRKGLSGGQKRRLSIAIELLSRPGILLLDEPTSGLDSSSTFQVIEHIVSLAKKGRTVICTIHQPSSAVYNMFSKVMLLVEGKTVFFGSPEQALMHFLELGYACPQYSNPAEHFVGLINTDFKGHADVPAFIEAFANSVLKKELMANMDKDSGGVNKDTAKLLRPSAIAQFTTLMKRNMMDNIRNPGIYWVRLFMYIMLSLMVGTMYLRTNDLVDDDYVPLLFYVQAFLVFMSVAVLPFFIENRAIFQRERANNSLNVASYVFANFLAALPGIFLIAVLSSCLVVFLAGLNGFGYFLLNLFLSLVVAESVMHVIGAAVPHYIIGIALGAGLFGMFMLCEGFMVPKASIPDYWIWGYYMAFHSYSFESFLYVQFKDSTGRGLEILQRYDMEDVNVDRNMIILACYAIVLQIIFYAILYKLHTGRR